MPFDSVEMIEYNHMINIFGSYDTLIDIQKIQHVLICEMGLIMRGNRIEIILGSFLARI